MNIYSPIISGSTIISGSISVTGNLDITGGYTGSLLGTSSYASQALSSSYAVSSSYALTASNALTLQGLDSASFAPASTFNTVSQSFAAASGSLSIRVTNLESTSSVLTSASSSFATMSGSLSTRVTNLEATSSTVSQSFATTSGSISGRVTLIEGQYATTGSNNFTGVQYISQASNAIGFTSTASLYTDGGLRVAKDSFVSGTAYFNNIVVYGTSSVQYTTSSQVNIGANIITVNTDTPAIRFGGLSVFDSGSTQLTGSILWDSQNNHWIYSNPSGSNYNSAMLMNGPRNTGSLGNEQGTTNNALMKGQGGDHITSSQVVDDGTTVRIPGNFQVTGSTILSSDLTGSSATFSGNVNLTGTATTIQLQGTSYGNIAADKDLYIDAGGSSAMYLRTNGGSTRVTITSAGRLDVAGEIRMTGSTLFRGMSSSTLQLCGGLSSSNVKIDGSTETVTIDTNGATRLAITSGGNVGIGTSSPSGKLTINTGTNENVSILSLGGGDMRISALNDAASANVQLSIQGSPLLFRVAGGVEAMRITSDGNVGIGTNSPNAVASGARVLQVDGSAYGFILASSGNVIGQFAGNIGGIVTIGSRSNHDVTFTTNDVERMRLRSTNGGQLAIGGSTNTFIDYIGSVARFYGGSSTNTFGLGAGGNMYYQGDNSQFYPTADNARSIGLASNRYTAIWAVNGSIQTSDEREKKDIVNTDLGLDFVTKLRPVSFKWKVGQNIVTTETIIDEEGNETVKEVITPREGKRTHYGLIAQEVEALLDGKDFGGFISDEETGLKGLRYDQFVPLLIKSIQEQQAQIEELKALINK